MRLDSTLAHAMRPRRREAAFATNHVRFTGACLLVALLVSSLPGVAASGPPRRAEALLQQMTLEEKLGQMTQVDLAALKEITDIQKYSLGSMLSGGGSDPKDNSPETWRKTVIALQDQALKTRLKVPLLYGIDAVHGHNNVNGATIFPHQIGLGATRNPALIERAARVTAREVAGTGMHWAFAPCIAVAQNIRWGRTYESFSDSPQLVGELGAAAVRGLQLRLPNGARILACAKHFAGDGGTQNGLDQGDVVCDEATFRRLYLAPYPPAIAAGSGSIMASYNSWNGKKVHGDRFLLTDVLKEEMKFTGLIVSDWAAIDQISPDFKRCIEQSINAGLDMVMVPNGPGQKNNYVQFITLLRELVADGRVPVARIDDAVLRILRVKEQMGLFEHPYGDPSLAGTIGSPEHREVARECVRQSLVLLKNDRRALPLSKQARLHIVGRAANDIGIQCGGWTIDWQGRVGDVIQGGTTILEAIRKTATSGAQITFSTDANGAANADLILVVLGEEPYAEMKGDRASLDLPAADLALLRQAKATGKPVVTLLLSGRPLVLGPALDMTDAFVAAWLPGTEGQGVADVLFGDAKFTGKLPRAWPANNDQLNALAGGTPLFPRGFGLSD